MTKKANDDLVSNESNGGDEIDRWTWRLPRTNERVAMNQKRMLMLMRQNDGGDGQLYLW